jgi:hypothetical protein
MDIRYCSYSKTIRQFPQNYLLIELRDGRWHFDPDRAADGDLVMCIFGLLFTDYFAMYASPELLIEKIMLKLEERK